MPYDTIQCKTRQDKTIQHTTPQYNTIAKHGYDACGGTTHSVFLKTANQHFFHFMQDATVLLYGYVLCKAFLAGPAGNSQELTLHATIAISGNVSSKQLLCQSQSNFLKKDYVGCMISDNPRCGKWPVFLLRSYCHKILQRIRNVVEVTARRCCNASGTS